MRYTCVMPAKRGRDDRAKKAAARQADEAAQAATVEEMANAGASNREIGEALGIAHTTVGRRYGDQLKRIRAALKAAAPPKEPKAPPAPAPHSPSRGRVFNETERELVRVLAGVGHHTQSELASLVGLSERQFRETFPEELAAAKAYVDGVVTASIIKNCLDGDGPSQRFYARARMGWNDRMPVQLVAPPSEDPLSKALAGAIEDLNEEGLEALGVVLTQLGERPLTMEGPGPDDPLN